MCLGPKPDSPNVLPGDLVRLGLTRGEMLNPPIVASKALASVDFAVALAAACLARDRVLAAGGCSTGCLAVLGGRLGCLRKGRWHDEKKKRLKKK